MDESPLNNDHTLPQNVTFLRDHKLPSTINPMKKGSGNSGDGGNPTNERLVKVECRLDNVESKLDNIKEDIKDLRSDNKDLGKKIDSNFKWIIGILITLLFPIIGLLVSIAYHLNIM